MLSGQLLNARSNQPPVHLPRYPIFTTYRMETVMRISRTQLLVITLVFLTSLLALCAQPAMADNLSQSPNGWFYTGSKGTVAFILNSGEGKALYRYGGDAYSKDLDNLDQNPSYYFLHEVNNSGYYWAIAKYPTWNCCGCWLGYKVMYCHKVGTNPPTLIFKFYATRRGINQIN